MEAHVKHRCNVKDIVSELEKSEGVFLLHNQNIILAVRRNLVPKDRCGKPITPPVFNHCSTKYPIFYYMKTVLPESYPTILQPVNS